MNIIPPHSSSNAQTQKVGQSENVNTPIQPVSPAQATGPLDPDRNEKQRAPDAAREPQTSTATDEATDEAVQKLNSVMQTMKRDLEFTFDPDVDRTIVTVRDSATQEVVRQLPSEAALKLAKILQDSQAKQDGPLGQLLNVKT